MGDPDDQMRLLEVRDWRAGQSWWDITQYRMNAPDGGDMHWSRLVDVPLGLVIILLQPILGQGLAEQAAAALVPLLTLAAAMFFYAIAARRVFGPLTAIVASGLLLTLTPFLIQMAPMRIDHHGWQLVCFLAALWALFDQRGSKWSALILGLSCALWIEISVEGLPFAALLLGVSALGWIFPKQPAAPAHNQQFPIALTSAAIGAFVLFSVTESWTEPNFCDALSPVHIAALGVMAAIMISGALLVRARPVGNASYARLGISIVAAVSGLATLRVIAPACAGDAFASLDPLLRIYWFDRTAEGLPLWSVPIDVLVQACAYIAAGGVALGYAAYFNKKLTNSDKYRLLLLFVGTIAIGLFVSRTIVYAMVIANMLLAAMAVAIFRAAEQRQSLLPRMGLRTFAIFVAMPGLFAQVVTNNINAAQATADPAMAAYDKNFVTQAQACQKSSAAMSLRQLPTSNIMAGLDTNPAILQFTQHKVVASGHHRNQKAMSDVIRTFTGTPDQAAEIISARNIRFIVICNGSYELGFYVRKAPQSMLAQLRAGHAPPWLQRKADIGPFQIFEVDAGMLPQQRRTL